jgi:hypothetical protein
MTIGEAIFVVLAIAMVVIALYAVSYTRAQRAEQRVISRLTFLCCPSCRHAFGASITSLAKPTTPDYDPLPGQKLPPDLPSRVWIVTCPSCQDVITFTDDGSIEHVRHYERQPLDA